MHKFVRRCFEAALGVAILSCGEATHPTGPGDANGPQVKTDAISSEGAAGPTIATDKLDYAPGDTVTITGAGWQPNETISIVLTEDPAVHDPTLWNVMADTLGGFVDRSFAVEESHLGVSFQLVATGAASADTAQGVFTDADLQMKTNVGTMTVNLKYYAGSSTCAGGPDSTVTSVSIGTSSATIYRNMTTSNGLSVFSLTPPTGTTFVNWTAPSASPISTMLACFSVVKTWTANFAINTTSKLVADLASPQIAGTAITFTDSVKYNTDNSGVNVDKVKFFDGGTDCKTGAGTAIGAAGGINLSGGTASVATSSLAVGTHTIWACYQGSTAGGPDILPSFSTMSFTINPASVGTSTAVGASPASPSEFGTSVTFTATVTQTVGGAAVTTGSVSFHDTSCGGTLLQAAAAVDGSGQKTYTTSSLAVGGHTIAVCYEGAAGFDPSNGTAAYTITKIATGTAVTSDVTSPQAVGTSVTFTATVTRTTGGAAVTTGNVRFIEGGSCVSPTTVLQAATTVNVSGQVTYTTSSLSVGSHTIVGCYDGDTNYEISSGSEGFSIDAASTLTSVSASPSSPQEYGTSVTFTAAVTSGGNPVLSGNVRFIEGGTCDSPTTTLKTATAVDGSGEVAYTTSTLSVGGHTIRACYDGVTNYAPSTGTASYTITKVATTTSLTSNVSSPQEYGTSVTFTAEVNRTTGGADVTSGSVTFYEGGTCASPGTEIQAATGVNGSGKVTFTPSPFAVGSHNIVACYGGDDTYGTSGDTEAFTVNKIGTTTTVTSDLASSQEFGTPIVFTAEVNRTTGGTDVTQGDVAFYDGGTCTGDGTLLQAAASVGVDGKKTYSTSTLSIGNHTIVGCYAGNDTLSASNGSESYTITKVLTTTAVTVLPSSPKEYGTSVTFTAKVTRTNGGADVTSGDVVFYEGTDCSTGTEIQAATGVSGTGTVTYTSAALTVGAHSILACYQENATYEDSHDAEPFTITKIATSTDLTSDLASPQVWSTEIVFTAEVNRVSNSSDVKDGTVGFYEGGSCAALGTLLQAPGALDGSGKKTFTTSSLSVGAHTIYACYFGNDTLAASGDSEAFTINKIPTTLTLSLTPSTSQQYSDSVALSASVSPNTVAGTVQFQKSVDGGAYSNIGSAVNVVSGAASLKYSLIENSGNTLSFKAVFTPTDTDHYDGDDDSKGLTVTKEDAKVGFDSNNPAALQVSAPGGTLDINSLTLLITVREKYPDATAPGTAPGDINKATLAVSLNPISGGSSISLQCTMVFTSGAGYSAYQTYTCKNSVALAVSTYQVDASVPGTNLYYTGGDTDAFTVFDPSLGFATGGGTFNLNGDRVNFGFTMKYNKSGASLQGNLIAVRHHPDGTVSRIKSNSLGGLALGDANGCGTAQFSGKATYTTWSSSINDYVNTGNNTFYVYAKDCNNPGTGYDYIWIDGPGNFDMPGTGESGKQQLTGGNIAVPHKPAK